MSKSMLCVVAGSILLQCDAWIWGTVYLSFAGAGLLVLSMFLINGD